MKGQYRGCGAPCLDRQSSTLPPTLFHTCSSSTLFDAAVPDVPTDSPPAVGSLYAMVVSYYYQDTVASLRLQLDSVFSYWDGYAFSAKHHLFGCVCAPAEGKITRQHLTCLQEN